MASLNVFSRSFLLLLCVSASMGQDWCVVRQGASEDAMTNYFFSACKEVDCTPVNPRGDCFLPDNLINHVSYVLNLKYRQSGACPSYLGARTSVDPSYGKCKYA
ncbi:glucan endo-1,3-beta-glucosidase-like [Primulina huaijiensis]|uniref:glucan endo-1,3-beta-glucosidase-like n=1 Tax=Primulina huaijiensis TaxID=1492673 RepID=UPI003CC72C8B